MSEKTILKKTVDHYLPNVSGGDDLSAYEVTPEIIDRHNQNAEMIQNMFEATNYQPSQEDEDNWINHLKQSKQEMYKQSSIRRDL